MIKEYRFEKAFLNNRKVLKDSIPSIMSSAGIFSSILFSPTVCAYLSIYQVAYCHTYDFSVCGQDSDKKCQNSNSGWEQQYSRRKKSILVKGEMHSMGGAPLSSRNLFFECLVSPAR